MYPSQKPHPHTERTPYKQIHPMYYTLYRSPHQIPHANLASRTLIKLIAPTPNSPSQLITRTARPPSTPHRQQTNPAPDPNPKTIHNSPLTYTKKQTSSPPDLPNFRLTRPVTSES
ncbi:hypothetical protein L873DRAFT_242727 [Choiromyces venosus 120613-1]|uniref:Uncharacterized protein n=1 Tax=Choiromyces venosus 120613-1 TaxID=1336337 RepID=A0A3N4J6L2_9PEZI|nr:hypothetical protein L873DRAFT_242727 [Choiromyces venosus 120613-1]